MAQTPVTATFCCRKFEEQLLLISGGIAPEFVEPQTFDTLHALQASKAMSEITVEVNSDARPVAGINTEWRVRFPSLDFSTVAGTTPFDYCTDADPADATTADLYDRATVDLTVNHKFTLNAHDFRDDDCIEPNEALMRQIRIAYRALKKGCNDALIGRIQNAAGNYFAKAGAVPVDSILNPKTLNLFTANSPTEPQPSCFSHVNYQYDRMGIGNDELFVLGGGHTFKNFYDTFAPLWEGSTETGYDVLKSRYKINRLFIDYEVSESIADTNEHIYIWHPRGLHFLEYFNFSYDLTRTMQGQAAAKKFYSPAKRSGTIARQVVDLHQMLPEKQKEKNPYPFWVDMEVILNDRCDKITYRLEKCFDTWQIPQEAFSADRDQQHNYVTHWITGVGNETGANLPRFEP